MELYSAGYLNEFALENQMGVFLTSSMGQPSQQSCGELRCRLFAELSACQGYPSASEPESLKIKIRVRIRIIEMHIRIIIKI